MSSAAHPDWIFFSDLDGTLLDDKTYQWRAASRALKALEKNALPLVIVSSKTRAEVLPLLAQLGRREPFVVENGGGIYVPVRYFAFQIEGGQRVPGGWWKVALGTPYRRLVSELRAASRTAGVRTRGFAQMSVREVAGFTGLESREARRAKAREFDEPFLILETDPGAWPRLRAEIRRRGLRATRGSRFFHIMSDNDKGAAVRRLTAWFRRTRGSRVRTVGLGDSPNDIPLLRAVDVPVIVAGPGGRSDPETLAAVPHAQRPTGLGPAGWNRAVLALLERRERPGA